MTYIAVPESPCHYVIRAGIHSAKDPNIIKGLHIVDGKNDGTYMELNPNNPKKPYSYKYGFYNHNRSIFHLFKYDPTKWSDDKMFTSNLPKCYPSKLNRSEEHTSELQSRSDLVCRLLLEKKKKTK